MCHSFHSCAGQGFLALFYLFLLFFHSFFHSIIHSLIFLFLSFFSFLRFILDLEEFDSFILEFKLDKASNFLTNCLSVSFEFYHFSFFLLLDKDFSFLSFSFFSFILEIKLFFLSFFFFFLSFFLEIFLAFSGLSFYHSFLDSLIVASFFSF
ncbi:unnamed protein product [Acanthosepion pharaonis]|uniref:Uncharacterized protein n=1 Tax=Acanthosepion pharaonis TaxID=158019 RepID=A0A812AKS7_ACAPH|nr:unnamed protein product [Sepia pharaonis]